MKETVIEAEKRTHMGKKVRALRRQGLLPAILYGADTEPIPIQMNAHEATQTLSGASGATLIDLNLEGDTHKVLVREVQHDVIRRDLLHVDFLKVAMDVRIRAEVPVELVGEAPAAKELGGVLVPGLNTIEVEALPSDLIDRVVVDLSPLEEIDDSIHVSDLSLGEGIEIITEPDELLARVIYQVEEVLEEEEEEEELIPLEEEPELIERGKRERELEEEGEPEEEEPAE